MVIKSLLSISLSLRYKRGSLTYSNLKPSASDASLYELHEAINSLQSENTESVRKILSERNRLRRWIALLIHTKVEAIRNL